MRQTAPIQSLRAALLVAIGRALSLLPCHEKLAACLSSLRSGAWLTRERLRVYPAMLGAALALAIAVVIASGHGTKDRWDRPIGVDFSGIWVAGEAVRAGHPTQPYDNDAHAAAQAKAFGRSDSYLPWPYPPYFLGVAAMLAALPYLAALALWQVSTLVLYIVATLQAGRGAPLHRRDLLIAALAFPAVTINILHGQNGFLSAALLALGGLLLPRRPVLAGLFLGCLAYKPQFAVALPFAILAGGHWRAAASAATTVTAMTLATWIAFGAAPWLAFADSLAFTRHVILEQGGLESWKLQSTFAAVRLDGGALNLAYGVQAIVSIASLAMLARVWRSDADHRLKVAALILASLLASPYAVDYDLAVLGPALAALVAHGLARGFAPWEKSLLALAWIMPLGARMAAMSLGVPIGVLTLIALYIVVVRRASTPVAQDQSHPIGMRPAASGG